MIYRSIKEKKIINSISYYRGLDESIPPKSEYTIAEPPRFWIKSEVKDRIKTITQATTTQLQTFTQ